MNDTTKRAVREALEAALQLNLTEKGENILRQKIRAALALLDSEAVPAPGGEIPETFGPIFDADKGVGMAPSHDGNWVHISDYHAILSRLRALEEAAPKEAEAAYAEGFLDGHDAAIKLPNVSFFEIRDERWKESNTFALVRSPKAGGAAKGGEG